MKLLVATAMVLFSVGALASGYPVKGAVTPFLGSRLYLPNDQAQHTAIVMLHGSEGGSAYSLDAEANVLATQGYAVLVLCYFDCNRGLIGRRETLKDVEAGIVLNAVRWLRKQNHSNGKVVVYGFSRGAELTLIAGSMAEVDDGKPSALIAHAPSDVFVGPFNWSWRDPICWLCKRGVGQCPSGSVETDYRWNRACGADDPTLLPYGVSAWLVAGKSISEGARIEIEKYDKPILITVGEKDEVWPVDQTRRVEASLAQAGRKPEIHYFSNAGHGFSGADEMKRRELVLEFLGRVP